jgi:hypothetical protein
MKNFKQVAPATAPKSQPAPEEPSITKHQMIAKVWKKHKDAMESAIAAFKSSVDADGCSYAMIWKGEAAMFAEVFLYETRGLDIYIEQKEPAEAEDLQRIRDCFERFMGGAATSLLGASEYSCDEGPWMPKSTSQMSNIETTQRANVSRRLIRMYTALIKCIDE